MRWRERRKAMQIQQTGIDRDWGSEGRQTRGGGGRTRDVGGGRAGSGEKKVDHVFVSDFILFFKVEMEIIVIFSPVILEVSDTC
jgi:hypothetical protein